jgi:hypothetical protein
MLMLLFMLNLDAGGGGSGPGSDGWNIITITQIRDIRSIT